MPAPGPVRRVTISIKLSPDIWKQAKRIALDRDITLGQLVENAILREIRSLSTQPTGSA
jgi:predicted DNA-binding ribbon-helix-helix protein